MATEVVMPQMGESIAEGTIVRWIKKVGETVERDEPLFEISTDKVDAEIPSPAAGVLSEVRAKEGETVPVNSVVAVIEAAGARPVAAAQSAPARPAAVTPAPVVVAAPAEKPRVPSPGGAAAMPPEPPDAKSRRRSSPLVRKIAKERNVDISQIAGTGISGRVTKNDILTFLSAEAPTAAPTTNAAAERFVSGSPAPAHVQTGPTPKPAGAEPGTVVPMSVMRRKIAEHMVSSRRTSAHVHSVFEVSFAQVEKVRQTKKAEYERAGAKLTYLSFIIKAATDALRAVPVINASVDGESIVYHKQVNVGIAVALDWGLIVPVVKNADEKNLLGISRAVVDLANRARNKQLKPEEVSGGTFTITNPGVFGALFGMPIINQPQVAILGVGAVEKRPVVIDDAIAIRPMAYLALGYDHRVIDGAVADEFMSHLKRTLEHWDQEQPL